MIKTKIKSGNATKQKVDKQLQICDAVPAIVF